MATTLAQLKTRLNTKLRDTANRTWTSDEKDEILKVAIDDPYVIKLTRDTSLSVLASTYSYTMPSGMEDLYDIRVDTDGTGIGQPISRDMWEVVDGFLRILQTGLPTGKTLILLGKTKLDTATTDYPVKVQNYILEMACIEAFEMLKTKLTTRFLTNDMTMSDIVQSIATHQRRAAELRSAIMNMRLVTL